MFRYRASDSASTLAVCSALSAIPSMAGAQSTPQSLPPVTVEAPTQRPTLKPARKPAQRTATASQRRRPVVIVTGKPTVAPSDRGIARHAADQAEISAATGILQHHVQTDR
jgi:iron complex outermembrane receptor protein